MRLIVSVVVVLVLAAACSDDAATGTASGTSATSAQTGPIAGPTTSTTASPDCLVLADTYLVAAAALFNGERPSDQVVVETRDRFEEIDLLASAGGCGDDYRLAVCDGLDELTLSGVLVIYPLVTAQCI